MADKQSSSPLEIESAKHAEAVERFISFVGSEEADAKKLVDAALAGIVDQALETITGSAPVPTAMSELKADQIRYACLRAGRILTQREVEILFRIKPSTASAILANMRAAYGQALRKQSLERMRQDAEVSPSGSKDKGMKWRIKFSESSTFEQAMSEILRLRLQGIADDSAAARTIEIPQQVELDGKPNDPLKLLGIARPD